MSRPWKDLGIYEFMLYFHLGRCLLADCMLDRYISSFFLSFLELLPRL